MPKTDENYKTKNAPASGTQIANRIHELRNNSDKLQKYCQTNPFKEEKETKQTKTQTNYGETLSTTYKKHSRKRTHTWKSKTENDINWAKPQEQWRTKEATRTAGR